METYIDTKILQAEPISLRKASELLGREIIPVSPETEGYLVQYPDGYQSFCPKSVFESNYRKLDSMTFGQALELLKMGKKVTRKGWNGKGMYLWLKPSDTVLAEWCRDAKLKEAAENNGGSILALGTICMYTHDSTGRFAVLTGWLASQSDMLSDDWTVLE